MKRNRRKDDIYGLSKRSAPSGYQAYNKQPYRSQNNLQSNQNFLPAPHHVTHNQIPLGSIAPNSYIYNTGNGWPMQPPMQFQMASYVHQTNAQLPHIINGPSCSSQTSPLQYNSNIPMQYNSNIPNFSTPPPPYTTNGQTNFQQTSNSVPTRARAQNDTPKRKWSREDAVRALHLEEELCKRNTSAPYLVIRFPDPPLDTEMVKGFSRDIEAVHFQKNSAPRFCFVRLKDDADAAKVIEEISKISFGMGNLSAELRFDPTKPPPTTKPEQVDPYTLYVGNLSLSVSVETIKRHFPGASRYDLAFKSKIKPIRYAFIRFESIEKAIEAFKHGINLQVDGRSLVLRFRRAKFNYPTENTSSSAKVQLSNNKSGPSVTDLTVENDGNVIQNTSGTMKHTKLSCNDEVIVKNENREGVNNCDVVQHIKEEHYDSEYSYEDECSNLYCEFPFNDIDQTDIKSETDDSGPCDSICSGPVQCEPGKDCDKGDYAGNNVKYSSNSSTLASKTGSESCKRIVNYVEAQVYNTIPVQDNFKFAQASSILSPKVSISEKKYIENLYDQLNSSRVLKKEVHNDFDEIEEMLKEVE